MNRLSWWHWETWEDLNVKNRLELMHQDAGNRVALVRLLFETAQNAFLQSGRDFGVDVARGAKGASVELAAQNFFGAFTREWFFAGQQFISRRAVSEDVSAMIKRLAQHLFRGHIGGSAWIF